MNPISYGQFSFSGGEYSPAIYSRVDIQKYSTGLRTCKNFFIHPHGGASNRPGTKYKASQGDQTKKARSVPFVFSKEQSYVFEFGDEYIRFYTNGAQIVVTSASAYSSATAYEVNDYVTSASIIYLCIKNGTNKTPATEPTYWKAQTEYEIYSPYLEADLPNLKFTSSADVTYITHPDYPTQLLTRYGDTDFRLEAYSPEDGPFMLENIVETHTLTASGTTGTNVNITSSAVTFDAKHVGALFKLTHYIEGQAVTAALASVTTTTSVKCFTTWRLITHGTWTGTLKIEKSENDGSTWTVLRIFTSAADFNVNTYGIEDAELNDKPFLVRLNMTAYTSGTCNADLTTDPFYQDGIIKIVTVTNSTAATADVLTTLGGTSATISWAEGSWSDYRGYPSECAFFQDRIVFASTWAEPMTEWMSKTGDYMSYATNQISLLDTDSISINLLTRQLNAINGLVPLGDLLSFTTASEWKVGSENGVISPTTIRSKVQGYRGSSGIVPAVIGNQIIYVQSNGKVVRNFGYDFSSDSFTGADLRILAEHLFNGHQIVDMAYQQDNDSILWVLREDGVLLSLTYMFEQEVVAWAHHETEGLVESICVIPGDGYDELWMTVKRGSSRFVEKMAQRMESTLPQDQYFVDCGKSYDNPVTITGITKASPGVVTTGTAHGLSNGDYVDLSDILGMTELNGYRFKAANVSTYTFELTEEDSGDDVDTSGYTTYSSAGYAREAYTTFTGLSHLNGMTVTVLGNGEVYPQQVVAGGEITLSRACSIVHIGLPYTCDLETLNVELGSKTGTIQNKKVKIGAVTFRLVNSRGGWIGPNEDTLYEAFTPERLMLGSAPALYTGDVKEALGAGYEDGGRVFYRQKDPLPITIGCVIPEISVG